jgi:hypothetical protein
MSMPFATFHHYMGDNPLSGKILQGEFKEGDEVKVDLSTNGE